MKTKIHWGGGEGGERVEKKIENTVY